jgi:hypothetical protein
MKSILILLAAGFVLAGTLHTRAQSQLLQLSPVEQNIARLSTSINAVSYYLGLAVQALNATHWVWELPDDELEPLLEGLGPQKVGVLVAAQVGTAQAFNSVLQAAGSTGARAISTPGRTFTWEGTNVVLAAGPAPTPEDQ